ncbi:CCAAT-binding factor isoform X2 [Tasmannia lanceolata]|uniref:CCAAT-binding factor isoform X2 n=1 Tax=Tasmannia lanceolata TaxID=3420 RepID=UPI004063CEA4
MASILSKKQKKRENYTLKDLKTLGQQLLSSRSHINNLPLLLSFISPSSPPQHALESLLSLQSFFIPVLPDLPPSSSKSLAEKEDPEAVYRTWLRSKFDQFINSLVNLAVSSQSDEALKDVALDAVMEFVKMGRGGRFQSAIYHKFLRSIVHPTSSVDFPLDLLVSKFFKYIDIRYFTYVCLEKFSRSLETEDITENGDASYQDDGDHISGSSVEVAIRKIHDILSRVPPLEGQDAKSDNEMWSQLGFSFKEADCEPSSEVSPVNGEAYKLKKCNNDVLSITKKMKLKFTKAWISFLRLPLPIDVYKEVLSTLHQIVIPHLANPIMLCDFLTRSYDIGGVISVMALSSLFILMTQHGLEYPNFYEKLYALLVPAIFMAKHRAKFFQLLDSCLKSTLLPAYLAAAFAKKLSRLALSVPPSGALVIIAIIHNLLRRHPSINCLVHRQADGETDGDSRGTDEIDENTRKSDAGPDLYHIRRGVDLFDSEQSDPAKSDAMRSSLWEIDTLRHHYCPAVSRFVVSLENDLTVRAKTSEVTVKDFCSGSYATIFRAETGRRIKQVPLAFYNATPTSLFIESDFPGWTFGFGRGDEQETSNGENGEVNKYGEEDNHSAKRQRIESSSA